MPSSQGLERWDCMGSVEEGGGGEGVIVGLLPIVLINMMCLTYLSISQQVILVKILKLLPTSIDVHTMHRICIRMCVHNIIYVHESPCVVRMVTHN